MMLLFPALLPRPRKKNTSRTVNLEMSVLSRFPVKNEIQVLDMARVYCDNDV